MKKENKGRYIDYRGSGKEIRKNKKNHKKYNSIQKTIHH